MFTYTPIDPIAIELGPIAVRWYGLMYVIGFLGGWWLGRVQARRPWSKISVEQVDDMVTWIALGVILGGRVGSQFANHLASHLRGRAGRDSMQLATHYADAVRRLDADTDSIAFDLENRDRDIVADVNLLLRLPC